LRCSSGSWTSELLDLSVNTKLAGYSATCPEGVAFNQALKSIRLKITRHG
jgi:hypothetical protein